jgi:hypothetical protein
VLVTAGSASAEDRLVQNIRADNGGAPYAGDTARLTTISPNGDGLRDRAHIRFELTAPAVLRLNVETVRIHPVPVYTQTRRFRAGAREFVWAPPAATMPRTYLVYLEIVSPDGSVRHIGPRTIREAAARDTPVIRVRGLDASFDEPSYRSGETARLTVATDVPSFRWRIYRAGVERTPTPSDDQFHGQALGRAKHVRVRTRDAPFTLSIPTTALPSGVYFVRLSAEDGAVGYAPFIVSPRRIGAHRVAVVLPTFTWQAYNFEDADGDGWGDTWYAGWLARSTRLGRHYMGWGMPPYFRRYDLPYLQWLARRGHRVDYLSDESLRRLSGSQLAHAYVLLIFPSHHEYVTQAEYRGVTGFRDRGGNLMFLSANNFFWKVVVHGDRSERTARWRTLGRPEASLLGAQYRANDHGTHKGAWVVVHKRAAQWLWRGTKLRNGSRFGRGGVEIDSRAVASPPGTIIVARIPHIYGRGFNAEMTYYETARGARVFSAGAMELTKYARTPTIARLLDNLWRRLAAP